MQHSTVAAISTPPGKGGIAVIRISGPQCYQVAGKVFVPQGKGKSLQNAKGYTAMFGQLYYKHRPVDEGIALCFRAPHSYTGEDIIELSCHGGEEVSHEVLKACIEAGASPAPPGEFTKRAVLNGRISLTQAEAVMDLISANSRQGVAAAKTALSGALFKVIHSQKQALLELAGHLAAFTDYPEEDVEALSLQNFQQVLQTARVALQKLADGYDNGIVLRRGVQAAIVGSPNVGKSTLFNLLSGFDRAIVTPVAGTTRDVLRESIQLGGISLNLSDTAGLHETGDEIEAEGIKRSYEEIEVANFVIAVFDGSMEFGEGQQELAERCKGRLALGIINKNDLVQKLYPSQLSAYFTQVVSVSAKNVASKPEIEKAVLKLLKLEHVDANAAMLANERQLAAVVSAIDSLLQAEDALEKGFTFDAAGVCLEDALHALAELTGESATEAIVEDVFSRFCVGK